MKPKEIADRFAKLFEKVDAYELLRKRKHIARELAKLVKANEEYLNSK